MRVLRPLARQRCISGAAVHEQVLTPKIFTLTRFQQHMIDDNYTAQACLRASPETVRAPVVASTSANFSDELPALRTRTG